MSIIDKHNRDGMTITMDISLSSKHVIRELDKLIAWEGESQCIRMDNGLEFIAADLGKWAKKSNFKLKFVKPAKRYQKGYVALPQELKGINIEHIQLRNDLRCSVIARA